MGFWRWYDRAARIDFAGTLLGIFFDWKTWAVWAGGTVVSLFISSYGPWTPGQAWLAALIGGACIAIIYIALSLFVYQLRSQRRSSLAKPEDVDGRPKIKTPGPDIDARVAFFEILKSSQWRLDQTPDTRDRLAVVLDREIHNLLAQSKLKAWGEKNLAKGTGPLREIAAPEWEEIEILFDEIQPTRPRTVAQYRVPRSHGSRFAYLGIKFSKEQVFSRFPLAAWDRPNWRIYELFSHIDPNVLNPSDAGRDPWEVVGGQIRDALSLRQIRIWGPPWKITRASCWRPKPFVRSMPLTGNQRLLPIGFLTLPLPASPILMCRPTLVCFNTPICRSTAPKRSRDGRYRDDELAASSQRVNPRGLQLSDCAECEAADGRPNRNLQGAITSGRCDALFCRGLRQRRTR
jgi:hypothetical protein